MHYYEEAQTADNQLLLAKFVVSGGVGRPPHDIQPLRLDSVEAMLCASSLAWSYHHHNKRNLRISSAGPRGFHSQDFPPTWLHHL